MLANKRLDKITEVLYENGFVDIKELANELAVSEKTIRLDLDKLQETGILERVHGGAKLKSIDNNYGPIAMRRFKYLEQKNAIALKALEYIEDNDTIYLDDGSTCLALAKVLNKKVTVISNDLSIINELSNKSNISLYIAGGEVRRNDASYISVGGDTISFIKKHCVNKAFISASTISVKKGLMMFEHGDVSIKRAVIESANKVICLADSSKFDNVAFNSFADINEIDMFITDKEISTKHKQMLKNVKAVIVTA